MSKTHFLAEKIKNNFFEFSTDSISHSRQDWKDLVQHILNNQYHLTNEYKIEETERIYKIHNLPLLCLPTQKTIKSIIIQIGSIIQYSILNSHIADIVIIPSLVEDQNKLLTQKRVTIIPPNDSRRKISLFPNQNSSDDLRQRIINAVHRNSYQDEFSSSLTRKRHYDNHLSRLSLRSISYGFDLNTKITNFQHENIRSSPNYRLPSNKIELDMNQHEIIHYTESIKKKNI